MTGSRNTSKERGRRVPPSPCTVAGGGESIDKPLVDRSGKRYRAEVLERWPAAVIRALGIRPLDDGGDR